MLVFSRNWEIFRQLLIETELRFWNVFWIFLRENEILKCIVINLGAHNFKKSIWPSFPPKLADFAKNMRPKDAEKQAVSLRNGPEKQAVSLCNGLEK